MTPKLILKSLKAIQFRPSLAFAIAFALPFNAKADGDNPPEYAHGTPIPEAQFCPTAPDVQAMIRYGGGSYVNMYTGAASYAINLYTYKDRDFTIPISISYNGDGFMPGRNPGCVGTGWFLNVGGVITREVRGLPDESTSHTYAAKTKGDGSVDNVFALASASGYGHGVLKQMLRDYNRMTSVDVYGFGARKVSSGQMRPVDYAYSGEIGREYVLFQEEVTSSSPRNFETESDLYHFSFMGINGSFILGDNGECIVLNSDSPAGELQITYNYNSVSPLRTTFTITTGDGYSYTFGHIDTCTSSGSWGAEDETPESEASVSCWKLTGIESHLGMKAEFVYQDAGGVETIANAVCLDNLTLTDAGGNRSETWAGNGLHRRGTVTNRVDLSLLTMIRVQGRANIFFTYDESHRLVSFLVNNMFDRRVRSCDMTYTPIGNQSLLKSVWLSGEGRYTFEYYDEERNTGWFPQQPTWKEDWYGYYSREVQDPDGNEKSLPIFSMRLKESRHKFDFEGTRALMLKRMTYPTGGHSEYHYEQNSYTSKPGRKESIPETVTGGVRVARIDTYTSGDCLRLSRRFRYLSATGKCSGILYEEPHVYYKYRLEAPALTIEREVVSYLAGQSQGGHIGYSRVLEEVSDEIGGEAKSVTEHRFLLRSDGPYEETYHSSTSDIITRDGWNFIFYDLGSDFPESLMRNGSLCAGRETGTTIYTGTVENGGKVSDTENKLFYWTPGESEMTTTVPSILQGRVFNRILSRRSAYVGRQSTTSFGSDHTPMRTTHVEITETSNTGRPASFSTTDSRDRTVVTSIEYRNDYPSYMSGRTVTVGGKTASDERFDYGLFTVNGKSRLLPSSIRHGLIATNGSVTSYEKVLAVKSYDGYGNPTEVEDALGNTATYQWGYSGLHMTMKTVKASGHRLAWFWTWNPLVGMTSAKEPDLTETIYGLDEFGRLTSVIESGDIIGKYGYNMTNQ